VLLLNGGGVLATAGVFAWGSVVMLVGDNVAQPALIGGEARLPLLWTLETFGLVGFFRTGDHGSPSGHLARLD
jgi:hypothetical protein